MGQGDQVHRHQVGVIRTIPAEYSITSRCTKPLRGREPVAKVCSPIVQLRMLDLRI